MVPVLFVIKVREHLNLVLSEKLIGRGGSIPWPPRVSDLTPVDFFVRRQTNQSVYSTAVVDEIDVIA